MLDDPLVNPFIVPAEQQQAWVSRQFDHSFLSQRFALGSQINDAARLRLGLHLAERRKERRAGHDHAGAAPVGSVVQLLVLAQAPLAQAMQDQFGRSELLGPPGNAVVERREDFGEESEDVNPHRHRRGVWRSFGPSRDRSREYIRRPPG